MFVSAILPDTDPVARGVMGEFLRISGDGPQIAGFFETARHDDVSEIARTVRTPTLVIHGDRDVTVPLAHGADPVRASGGDPRLLPMVSAFLAEDSVQP